MGWLPAPPLLLVPVRPPLLAASSLILAAHFPRPFHHSVLIRLARKSPAAAQSASSALHAAITTYGSASWSLATTTGQTELTRGRNASSSGASAGATVASRSKRGLRSVGGGDVR